MKNQEEKKLSAADIKKLCDENNILVVCWEKEDVGGAEDWDMAKWEEFCNWSDGCDFIDDLAEMTTNFEEQKAEEVRRKEEEEWKEKEKFLRPLLKNTTIEEFKQIYCQTPELMEWWLYTTPMDVEEENWNEDTS